MPLDDLKPYPKTAQLARKERRYRRQVASPKRWAAIADAKQGPCRCCAAPAPSQLHHIVSRAHGGSDSESNIAPLCAFCHGKITSRDQETTRVFLGSLTDHEYAYAVQQGGEDFFERAYGLRYAR